jgi:hypothetical protein
MPQTWTSQRRTCILHVVHHAKPNARELLLVGHEVLMLRTIAGLTCRAAHVEGPADPAGWSSAAVASPGAAAGCFSLLGIALLPEEGTWNVCHCAGVSGELRAFRSH